MKKFYPKAIPDEQRWVDFDEETGLWCIFGLESGHAYSNHCSEDDANVALDNFLNAGKVVS